MGKDQGPFPDRWDGRLVYRAVEYFQQIRAYDRCYCGDERLWNVVSLSGLRVRVCFGPIDLIHGDLPKREA